MKTKLHLLLIAILLSVSFTHAQKTDVWDFGGVAMTDTNLYNNMLTPTVINSNFYAFTTPAAPGAANTSNVLTHGGVAGNTNAFDLTGGLTFRPNTNDRLYVNTPTTITRYGDNNLGVSGTAYTSRIFCNGNASTTVRFFTMALNEDDEVTFVARVDNAAANLNIVNTTTNAQTENIPLTTSTSAVTEAKFMAKAAGSFKISCFDNATARASYYRILRKPASYSTVTGTMDETAAAGIPAGYSVRFTYPNGKTKDALVTSGTYSVSLPIGYTYKMSLVGANGYIIGSGENMTVTAAATTQNITVVKADLYTVSGNITGLSASDLTKVGLNYATTGKIYVPVPVINTTTGAYTVDLEANTLYTISATGVNDSEILANTISVTSSTTSNVAFTAKPLYNVAINTTGLNATQIGLLSLKFTNLNEAGYVYNFAPNTAVSLRSGTYSIDYSGLDNHQVELGLTSNLKIAGASNSKTLAFKPATIWSFDDRVITNASTGYKGILFGGTANSFASRSPQADLTAKTGGTMQIPVKVGDKITVSHYFAANFSIDGGTAIVNTSGSTANVVNTEYTYPGSADGFVTITLLGTALTSYFTEIKIGGSIAYTSPITVGVGKNYATINDALTAAGKMVRPSNERVIIVVDPGNYEEMLDITIPNITIKNASATPSIALANKGVDIAPQAVRITSYYGLGYDYYSMKNNQKWDADILRVNKENGSQPYANVSGTTNNSYWNATLIVSANGFEAENIIIENSFNQYISAKEANDVLVEVVGLTKGTRPTNYGNTSVQNRSFVERAAAIAIKNAIDKTVLNNCRVVGRQDSFFGGTTARVVVYKGVMMGAVDYIFGGMNATFYKTQLAMNVSDTAGDASYITAPQQSTGRGFLFYECTVTSAIPSTETASVYRAKPGFFGRPWAANTSEAVFYNTTIETSDYPGNIGESLITPIAWNSSLSGTSPKMYEYGTIENSGVNNQAARASWATTLSSPTLSDNTAITTFNFTKGSDNWDPLPQLIANESLGVKDNTPTSAVNVVGYKNRIAISNIKSETAVAVYSITGAKVKAFKTNQDVDFEFQNGVWVVVIKAADGQKSLKVITH